jgi:hypothetical protein
MPQVEFEPTTPVFLLTKSVHFLERSATVIGTGKVKRRVTYRKLELRGLSSPANCTDRVTTACRRS